jgi:hypothetical protein
MPELAPASDGQSVLDPNKKDEKDIVANNNGTGIKNPEEWPESKSLSDSNGMPSATGQPYPASTKDSLFEDEEKTETGNSATDTLPDTDKNVQNEPRGPFY